jgi:pyrroline-5-carboxylate reductase
MHGTHAGRNDGRMSHNPRCLDPPIGPPMRIAFVGGGNMATALVGSLVAKGSRPSDFVVVEPFEAQRVRLAERFRGIALCATAEDAALDGMALVVLAVKPQQMRDACNSLRPRIDGVPAVLSIAAGTRIDTLSRWLGGYARIVRAMPNTPSLIGAGITGVYAPPTVDAAGREAASVVLGAAGEVLWCGEEAMLDAVTGVSASGPAYVFYCLEALEQAANELGFTPDDARMLAYATFEGAVKLARASDFDVRTLRAR